MFRYLFCLLLLPFFTEAQKVVRATKLLQEGKYPKSAELFGEVLEKDTVDVAATFGYVIAVIRQAEKPDFVLQEPVLMRFYRMIKRAEKDLNYLSASDKNFVSSEVLQSIPSAEYSKWISETLWLSYMSKTTSPAALEGYQRGYYFNNKLISNSDLNNKVEKLYYDSLMVVNTKPGWQFFVNKYPRGIYLQDARRNITKIDFNAAMNSSGTDELKTFIATYPNDQYTGQVKAELEKREYTELQSDLTETNIELYLKKYPASQYKITLQEKLAGIYLERIKSSDNLSSIEQVVQKLNAFTPTQTIKNAIDRAKMIAFKVEYNKVKDIDEPTLLNAFLSKYSYLKNDEIEEIKSRYFLLWNDRLNEEGLQASVSDVKRFIEQFEEIQDSSFFNLGTKVVVALNDYLSTKKEDMVEYVLRNRMFSAVDLDVVKQAVRVIAPMIKFDLQLTSQEVMDQIESYEGDAKTIADLSSIFIKNMTSNDLLLGTEGNDDVHIFSINRVGDNQKINTRTYIWNGLSYNYVELGTKDPIYGIIATRYGISSFSKPFFTGEVEGEREYIVRLYGYRKTDRPNYPGFAIDMYYKLQNSKWVPDRARAINYHYDVVSFSSYSNTMYNFASELQVALNGRENNEEY